MSTLTQQELATLAPEGVSVVYYEECGSTNSIAVEQGAKCPPQPTWYVAGQQTAGRGRRGREWRSRPGNFYGSLLTKLDVKITDLATLPYVVALAVRDTFIACGCSGKHVQCKWPNDVLIHEKKAAGILIESSADGQQNVDFLVIGVGLNLLYRPEDAQFPATSVSEHIRNEISPVIAFQHLSQAMHKRLTSWRPDNVADVVREWSDASWGIGMRREIRTTDENFTATLEGLNSDGGLRLRLDNGSERILYAGDVFSSPPLH